MTYSTLKRKTTLKTKTRLKSSNRLQQNTPLKVNISLRDSYSKKIKSGIVKQKKKASAYKPKYKYESIFTNDLNKCCITGCTKSQGYDIHVHHIFGAANKANSEKYHFLIPLRADWHDMADYGVHFNRELDLKIKRACQEYWLKHYGTKDEFIKVFGKWW